MVVLLCRTWPHVSLKGQLPAVSTQYGKNNQISNPKWDNNRKENFANLIHKYADHESVFYSSEFRCS